MIVRLRASGEVSVVDVDNLSELKVVTESWVTASALEGQLAGLAGLGSLTDGHAWLDVDALRDAARPTAASADWDSGFRAMILYASARGWTDAAATSVRAHVEHEDDTPGQRIRPGAPDVGAR